VVDLVVFDIDDAQLDAYFAYAGQYARDMRPPFQRVAAMTIAMVFEQFQTEGAKMSGGWRPLNPRYEAQKAKDGYGGMPILQRTGRLFASAVSYRSAIRVTRDSMQYKPHEYRNGVDLVEVHMSGREGGGKGGYMPARPIFEDTAEWYDNIEEIFVDWLDDLRGVSKARGGIDASIRPDASEPTFILYPGF
jgi:hypothetical protein